VINQLEENSAFSLDMVNAFKLRLGDNPLDVVHRDPSISEALAFATDPLDKLTASAARDDLNRLCRLLITWKNLAKPRFMRETRNVYAQSAGRRWRGAGRRWSHSHHGATACFTGGLWCEQKMNKLAFRLYDRRRQAL
jgi:hypothetical protein